jgi:hypothetical protein
MDRYFLETVLENLIAARLVNKLSMLHRSWWFPMVLTEDWHPNLSKPHPSSLRLSILFLSLAILIPAYERWIGVWFPPGARDSSCHQSTDICSEAHSASFGLAIRTFFFGSRVAMAWSWLVRHSLVQIWKTCRVIPPFPRTPSWRTA